MKRNALLFNMTLNEFWYGNPQDFYVYADAYQEKQNNIDYCAWINGYYNLQAYRQALSEAFGKGTKKIFPEEPLSEKEKEKQNGVARNDLQSKILAGLMRAKPTKKPINKE